jgi:hypothetical protein
MTKMQPDQSLNRSGNSALSLVVHQQKMTDAEYLERFNAGYWQTLEDGGVPALSRLQRGALCIMSFQGEINNGGMHQYLLNSSGDFAQEAPEVMRRIGADAAAVILEKANSYFGPDGPPIDREPRMDRLLALPENVQKEIHDLTDEFYDAEDRGLCLADLFDAYVLSQRLT